MKTNELTEWENRFIKATRRFPPGRDIPEVLEADELRATSLELWRWIAEQLHDIVAKLPKTADGVPVVPGVDHAYCVIDGIAMRGNITDAWTPKWDYLPPYVLFDCEVDPPGPKAIRDINQCYSTQAAAEAEDVGK